MQAYIVLLNYHEHDINYAYHFDILDWNTLVVGKVSPWIDTDAHDETERKNSEQVEIQIFIMIALSFMLQYRVKTNCRPTI